MSLYESIHCSADKTKRTGGAAYSETQKTQKHKQPQSVMLVKHELNVHKTQTRLQAMLASVSTATL